MLKIRLYQDSDKMAWDAYVINHPHGTVFHLTRWKNVIEKTFGHKSYYLIAEDNEGARLPSSAENRNRLNYSKPGAAIVGIFPLFEIRSLFFGNYLVSVPFAEAGGPIVESDLIERELIDRAIDYTKENRLDYLEMRNIRPLTRDFPGKELYYNFKREIFGSVDDNLKAIPRKARRMIRQGEKNNLSFLFGKQYMAQFYEVLARNYHNLGTPVFSSAFFDNFCTEFEENCNILLILNDEKKPIAGVLFLLYKDQVLPYFAGSLVKYRKLAPNDFMYWQLMKYGFENSYRVFDFGRSKKETGSFDFKRHWGLEPKLLHYQYYLNKGTEVPNLSPANPKYKMGIRLWRKLPFQATRLLGPSIAKYLA